MDIRFLYNALNFSIHTKYLNCSYLVFNIRIMCYVGELPLIEIKIHPAKWHHIVYFNFMVVLQFCGGFKMPPTRQV